MGWCCVAHAFDRGDAFAFDKAANEPCRHLSESHRCRVHDSRAERGLSGCASYDCYGAGQLVTARYLARGQNGARAASSPRLLEAFRALRTIHSLRYLLHEAARFREAAAERAALLARLEPASGFELHELEALDLPALESAVFALLRGLAYVLR